MTGILNRTVKHGQPAIRPAHTRPLRIGALLAIIFTIGATIGCQGVADEAGLDPAAARQSQNESLLTEQPDELKRIPPISEARAAESHQQMIAALQEVIRRTPDENGYVGNRLLRETRKKLEALGPTASAAEQWSPKYRIAMYELRLGNEDVAIELFNEVYRTFSATPAARKKSNFSKLALQMGIAHLRLAETQNCCQRYTVDSCLFPIQGKGIHEEQEPSRTAIKYFTQTLKTSPPDTPVHLSARWLLNIAYMTVGEYPDGVPNDFLIPPHTFETQVEFPRFKNVAPDLGLATFSLAGGTICDDFDNDGHLDLLVSNWDPTNELLLFHNNADGTFTERGKQAGLTGIFGGLNLIQADYDNDGWVDILVLRGAWLGEGGAQPNSLLRNLGNGRFVDVTFAAGLADARFPTQTAAWADFNNDGYLDLYVGSEGEADRPAPCQLYRNNKDGTFTDIAVSAGVTNDRFTKAVVWGDIDQDDLPDLYVSNVKGLNRLYHNNGNGTFTDVAGERGVTAPIKSFPAWFWDFDNDGDLDIFASSYQAQIADIAAAYLSLPHNAELACLYQNDGTGRFTNVAEEVNLVRPNTPMGSNFGDLDNDGFLDFYLGTGEPAYRSLMPNAMYWNRGGKRFEDVTVAGGFGSLQKGHAVVFADLDNDGDQDVFEQMGGAYAGDSFVDALYRNPGFGNHWLSLQLVGTKSNRSAIGARIRVMVQDQGQPRAIVRYVNSGGSFGANPLRQHFGLGKADRITSVEVYWPTSKLTQTFENVSINGCFRIKEGVDQLHPVELKPFQLGPP